MPTATDEPRIKHNPATGSIKVLAAGEPVSAQPFKIGERTYNLAEMSFVNTLAVGDIITEEIDAIDQAGLLNPELWRNFNPTQLADLARMVGRVWQRVPSVLGKLLALALDAQQPDDASYIITHLRPSQVGDLLIGIMAANDIPGLVKSFFRVRREAAALAEAVCRAQQAEGEASTS